MENEEEEPERPISGRNTDAGVFLAERSKTAVRKNVLYGRHGGPYTNETDGRDVSRA